MSCRLQSKALQPSPVGHGGGVLKRVLERVFNGKISMTGHYQLSAMPMADKLCIKFRVNLMVKLSLQARYIIAIMADFFS